MHFSLSFLVSIAFLAITINGQVVCPKYECVKPLEECGNINYTFGVTTYVGCKGESTCTVSSSASTLVRGFCQAPIALGEPCESSGVPCESGSNCGGGTFCRLNTPPSDFLYPGESCKLDTDCVYTRTDAGEDVTNLCEGGHCKKINNGDYCDDDYQCDYNKAYCSNSRRCEKNIEKGGLCNRNDATYGGCGRKSRCMPTSSNGDAGTCQPYYSLGEGKFCQSSSDCKEELHCGQPRNSNEEFGVCIKPMKTATLNTPCVEIFNPLTFETVSSCNETNTETCRCTDKSATQVCILSVTPKGYWKAQWNFAECTRKKCGMQSSDFLENNKCIYDHCRDQACSYYKIQKKGGESNCQFDSFCNSGFILSFSPFLILSAFVAVFLF